MADGKISGYSGAKWLAVRGAGKLCGTVLPKGGAQQTPRQRPACQMPRRILYVQALPAALALAALLAGI